jgi:hypothetical protein
MDIQILPNPRGPFTPAYTLFNAKEFSRQYYNFNGSLSRFLDYFPV